jgi:ribose transport system substrate-binding protein
MDYHVQLEAHMTNFPENWLGRRGFLRAGIGMSAAIAASQIGLVSRAAAAEEPLSLKGKKIAISATGTDHYWDLKAYQAQIDEVKSLGGEPLALDAGRDDKKLVAQLQTLIAQRPDAVIQTLGTLSVIDPWLKKLKEAGIPVFTADVPSSNSINNATSDNFGLGSNLALRLVSDIGGEGNIVVFNGFYGVPVCAIRYDELKEVLKYYPAVKIIQPELRDVIPNTVQDAVAQVTAVLTKYPDKGSIKAIWSAWDIPQLCATQALISAGRTEVKTYGVDGTPEVVELVKDPNSPAAAVAAQQPSLIGKTAVQNVARYFAGDKTLPQATYISSLLVTKENAAEAQKALGQILRRSGEPLADARPSPNGDDTDGVGQRHRTSRNCEELRRRAGADRRDAHGEA